jgi:hypothetical protein
LITLYGKSGRDLAIRSQKLSPKGAVADQLSSATSAYVGRSAGRFPLRGFIRTVPGDHTIEIGGLKTIAEINGSAAANVRGELLASLVESAARLGQYDRAMAIERLRAAEAVKPDEKTAIEKRLAEIVVAEKARQARLALLTRIDRSNAISSIYATRLIGDN